jgi:LPXTG-site transpeptidase (sortase) family protein
VSSLHKKPKSNKKSFGKILIAVGIFDTLLGLALLGFIVGPVIAVEARYQLQQPQKIIEDSTQLPQEITTFGVSIPKIGAQAPITAAVDPFSKAEYSAALEKGVAHAKNTSLPGESGNVFLFAHSSGPPWEMNHFNTIFFLLNKLVPDDEIIVYKDNLRYQYRVTKTEVVNPNQVEYLDTNNTSTPNTKTITLMTCTPAGTTLQRLLVFGELVE